MRVSRKRAHDHILSEITIKKNQENYPVTTKPDSFFVPKKEVEHEFF